MNIAVIGVGGIGGHIAGLLCNKYANQEQVNIYLVARGEHLKAIQERGLTLIIGEKSINCRPTAAESSAEGFPKMDYIFYCTKSYDIEASVSLLKPMLKSSTTIIPILNGVDGADKMRKLLPEQKVCDGLAFIVSYIKESGVIENSSKVAYYFFGDGNSATPALKEIEAICTQAGIDIKYTAEIGEKVWEKYCFISAAASMTTAYNNNYGLVLNTPHLRSEIKAMIDEFEAVAIAKKGFKPNPNRNEGILKQMATVPPESTTSMQRDFWSGKNCEVESLTNYIILEGEKLGIATPTYRKIYSMIMQNRELAKG